MSSSGAEGDVQDDSKGDLSVCADDGDAGDRKRRAERINGGDREKLEYVFLNNPEGVPKSRVQELADLLGIEFRRVYNWFNNRRARERRLLNRDREERGLSPLKSSGRRRSREGGRGRRPKHKVYDPNDLSSSLQKLHSIKLKLPFSHQQALHVLEVARALWRDFTNSRTLDVSLPLYLRAAIVAIGNSMRLERFAQVLSRVSEDFSRIDKQMWDAFIPRRPLLKAGDTPESIWTTWMETVAAHTLYDVDFQIIETASTVENVGTTCRISSTYHRLRETDEADDIIRLSWAVDEVIGRELHVSSNDGVPSIDELVFSFFCVSLSLVTSHIGIELLILERLEGQMQLLSFALDSLFHDPLFAPIIEGWHIKMLAVSVAMLQSGVCLPRQVARPTIPPVLLLCRPSPERILHWLTYYSHDEHPSEVGTDPFALRVCQVGVSPIFPDLVAPLLSKITSFVSRPAMALLVNSSHP